MRSASAHLRGLTSRPPTPQRVEVTGQRDAYLPPPSSTASRTDTPNPLVPQSVQIVPRAVLNEQKALTLADMFDGLRKQIRTQSRSALGA